MIELFIEFRKMISEFVIGIGFKIMPDSDNKTLFYDGFVDYVLRDTDAFLKDIKNDRNHKCK